MQFQLNGDFFHLRSTLLKILWKNDNKVHFSTLKFLFVPGLQLADKEDGHYRH